MGSGDLWDSWQERLSRRNGAMSHIDQRNQRLAAILIPPGPIGPLHQAHSHIPHPAETPLRNSSSPLLRLPTELMLEIFGYIQAERCVHEDHDENQDEIQDPCLWAILALRGTCGVFRDMIPPLTHEELLDLEVTLRAQTQGLHACVCCLLLLRHQEEFSQAQVRIQNRGVAIGACSWQLLRLITSGIKRFCLDCGFAAAIDPSLERGKAGYAKGSDVVTFWGERWVWCWWCDQLKKGEEAGVVGKRGCRPSCAACCADHGCTGGCALLDRDKRRMEIRS